MSKNWDQEIIELKDFFSKVEIKENTIKLSKHETITDVKKFIESHLSVAERNNGKKTFLPYLERLIELKKILENEGK